MSAPALTPGKLWGLRRMSDEDGLFRMVAVDQRPPIKAPIAEHYGGEAPYGDVAEVKAMLIEELQGEATAMLLDPHYAMPRGLHLLSPSKGLVVTLEDSNFKETPAGRLSSAIDGWSVEKIKRSGGDAVKVLAWYRPDAGEGAVRHQRDFVARIGEACARYDIPFLLEMLAYPLRGEADQTTDYRETAAKRAEHVLGAVEEFAKPDYGVDLFKLEAPVPGEGVPGPDGEGGAEVQKHFDEMGRLAGRPWIMLSAGVGKEAFGRVLAHAFAAGASGYLAGRAIWMDAFRLFPDWDAMRLALRADSVPYMRAINALTSERATPWHRHHGGEAALRLAPDDGAFRYSYEGFGAIERFGATEGFGS